MRKFEKVKFDIRIGKVRQCMAERNIEVMIVTDPSKHGIADLI